MGARKIIIVPAMGLALGGCVAGMVASAAGMAVQAAKKPPQSNEHLQPTAKAECSKQAARYGAVHVIDVAQHGISKIVVWGTVDDGTERKSFECGFTTKIAYFRLREIRSSQ